MGASRRGQLPRSESQIARWRSPGVEKGHHASILNERGDGT